MDKVVAPMTLDPALLAFTGIGRHLPHYGHWAVAIGVTVMAITLIALTLAAIGNRRRR